MIGIGLFICLPCYAGDHAFVFQEEYYNETVSSFSHTPVIYHSIQVLSQAGPKLIILTGDHPNHRKWLRQYLAEDRVFMALVQDADNDQFIASRVFEIDVRQIHPLGPIDSPEMKQVVQSIRNPKGKQKASSRQVQPKPVLKNTVAEKKPDLDKQAMEDKIKAEALASETLKASQQTDAEKEKAKALASARQVREKSRQEAQALLQLAEEKARQDLLEQRLQEAKLRWQEQSKNLKYRENETAVELEKRLQEIEMKWRDQEKMHQ